MLGLNTKTASAVLNDMVGWITSNSTKLTNFSIGSVIRTLLESISIEIESLYFQMNKGLKKAIEQSMFNSFGFYRSPATPSTGVVTIYFREPMSFNFSIPKGYRFITTPILGQSLYFVSTSDSSCTSGDLSMNVPVECESVGEIGNVMEDSIKIAVTPYPFISSITNILSFKDGRELEQTEELKKRFSQYIQTLSRGTVPSIYYGCITVKGVAGVSVEEHVGRIIVYAHDMNGNLTPELKNAILANVANYKSGGIEILIMPIDIKIVDLSVTVLLEKGFSIDNYKVLIQKDIIQYLNSYTVSVSLIQSELTRHIMSISKLAISDISLSLTGNVVASPSQLIRPGVITVNSVVG